MATSTYSCNPCNISCPIPTTPGCPTFSSTSSRAYFSPTSTYFSSTFSTCDSCNPSCPFPAPSSCTAYVTPNSEILGIFAIISGVILPICIALSKKAQQAIAFNNIPEAQQAIAFNNVPNNRSYQNHEEMSEGPSYKTYYSVNEFGAQEVVDSNKMN